MNFPVGIEEFVDHSWETVFAEIHDAAVYIDQAAAECLHWYTAGKGYLALIDAGAVAVHELGMYHFRYVEVKETKKAVVLSTSGDPAFYQRTIKMILAKNAFERCTVLCGAPSCSVDCPGTTSTLPSQEKLDYTKLKRDIKNWMISRNFVQEPSVNIVYAPIFIAFLSKDLFVTPPFGDLMPTVNADDVTEEMLVELNRLAYTLYYLFEHLNARPDVYSMGKMSERLAENLTNLIAVAVDSGKNVPGSPETGITVILIDRTLDLCTPTSNNTESFLAKLLCTLPRLPRHTNDVAIDMSPIFSRVEDSLRAYEVPGCLASTEKNTMDLLISETPRKILTMTNQSLNDMISIKSSPKPRTWTRISGHSLEKLLGKVRGTDLLDSMATSGDKLQTILAIVEASTSEKNSQLELLTSLEKLVLQNLSVSRESSSILAQLSNIIRTRTSRGLEMENLLPLLIHVYALAGTQIRFSNQQEDQLKESIADAIFEDIQFLRKARSSATMSIYQRTLLLLGNDDHALARDTSAKIAVRVIDILRSVAEQRSTLQDYRSLMVKPSSRDTLQYVGILEQLITDLLRSDVNHELRDLRQKSSSFISAGFNLFLRGKTKRHPRDNPWILIYVVGGITPEEAKMVREATSIPTADAVRRVTLAGSRLLNPLDIAVKILLSSINN